MNYNKIGLNILKFSLVFVYFWFGIQQVTNPTSWTGLIPDWILSITPFTALTWVYINGIFEIVAAVLLIIPNRYTKFVAIALFIHLVLIIVEVGISPTGIRDIGLAGATLALVFLLIHE